MIVYDGPATGIWESAGKVGSNGQKWVSLTKLRQSAHAHTASIVRIEIRGKSVERA
jgi:hypothetical protein